jgi:5-methylcytosine-specific restriction protein A
MATGAPHPCCEPGCRELVTGERDRCDPHAKAARARHRASAPPRTDHGGPKYDTRWAKARRGFLAKHPTCTRCGGAATVVDHIKPHRGSKELFWSRPNWQPLCKHCHDRKTALEDGRFGFALRPTTMAQSKVPLLVVCGPPGAGKSLLVQRHARPEDLVIELDAIKAELSGMPLYQADHAEWMQRAMRERNRRLLSLCEAPTCPRAWLTTSAPAAADRRWWRDTAGARTLLVLASPDVCRARVRADTSRPPARTAERLKAIDEWFARYTADPYGDELVGNASTANVTGPG